MHTLNYVEMFKPNLNSLKVDKISAFILKESLANSVMVADQEHNLIFNI